MKQDRPSATASLVLKALLFAAHDPIHGGLVPPETVRWSESIAISIIKFPKLFLFAIRNRLSRWLLTTLEETLNPGFILHVATRKGFIDKISRQSIRSGSSQIIVIGAGYDTIGLSAAISNPAANCFEIDHATTQKTKITSFASSEIPPNLFFIPADLSATSIGEVLTAHPKFDSMASTLIVIEGVLMYLPDQAVRRFFEATYDLFRGGLTCIFTFMDRRSNGDIQFKKAHPLINSWLRFKHEQFLSGFEKDQLAGYLATLGFSHTDTYGKSEFISAFFPKVDPAPLLAEGEFIGVTSK